MGKKLNLSHLNEEECDQIMRVLEKDFEVRKADKRRLNEVQEALMQEQMRISILQQKRNFNLSNCIVCLERFGFFSHRKRNCVKCKLNVCRACCSPKPGQKGAFLCSVCSKEKAYKMLSNEWFRKNFHLEEKHNGSSKIVRSLYKRNTSSSDTEVDSGFHNSAPGSAHWPRRGRPRLDNVFDLSLPMTSTPKEGMPPDEALGLPAFPELPNQSTSVPTSNRPSLRATSLESILPSSKNSARAGTPIGTQTLTPHRQVGQSIPTQTSVDVENSAVQTQTQTSLDQPPRPRTVSTGTETGLELDRKTPSVTLSKAVETAGQQTSPPEQDYRGLPLENGDLHNGRSERISSVRDSGTETPSADPTGRSRTNSGGGGARPRSEDFDSLRNKRRRDRETKGLYREAFDGAKRAEEFKFRVKFDQFLGDLHHTLDERSPHGLPASFASPSYGEVMLLFRDKVKELLKGFTHRLQLAHESFGNVESESGEDTAQKVKQDVSRFIEDLIGETLDLTSDEAVSDLSSLSDEASPDQPPSFEDLLAQAVVTKLLENHRKAVRDSLEPANDNDRLSHYNNSLYSNNGNYNSNHRSFDHLDRQEKDQVDNSQRHFNGHGFTPNTREYNRVRNFISLDQNFVFDSSVDKRDFQSSDGGSRDFSSSSADIRGSPSRAQHPRDVFGGYRQVSVTSLHAEPSLNVDGGGLYSRTISNQNVLNTSADQDNLLVPQSRFSSEEDEEGDVKIEDRTSDRSRNNSSSSNNNHIAKTGKQLSTSSTSSLEPETLTKDHNRSRSNSSNNHSNNHSNNEFLAVEDQITPTPCDRLEGEDTEETESVADPEKDFLELKDFVRQTQEQGRPKVQARFLEEQSERVEVQEEQLLSTSVDRDEEREQFHARYSILDRIHNSEPALPDFSQFENIDFSSSEIDPDLLSMNLAIIPEETEEELEQEEEESGEDVDGVNGKWRNNWIFKGKGVSAYDNLGKKKLGRFDQDGPQMMMVPRPEDDFGPKVGNRDVDQLSDFSDGDLLTRSDLDNTDDDDYEDDDDENSFYANTSKELARIARRRLRSSRNRKKSVDRLESKLIPGLDKDTPDLDFDNQQDQTLVEDIPGPIVQPVKPEVELLYDLIPADEDDPKFLVPPECVTIQEGEPVQFTCRVGGTEPYGVFWYREGDEVEELEEGEDVEMGSTGDKHWVTLYHVGHKQSGQYMCIALSDKGKAIQYLVITVKDNKQELKKPEFLKGLKDVEVTEGESVKFRVKVKGYPQPRVTWFKDGQLLKPSRSCRIEKFGNRDYILTIDYATMDDDAEYTVSARNVAGTEKLSAQVIVEPRSELPPRRQMMSSLNTSAASDSDSDITVGYKRRSYNLSNSKPSSPSSPFLVAARRAPSPSSLNSPSREQQQQQQQPREDGFFSPTTAPCQESELMSQSMSGLIESLPLSLTAQPSPRSALQERENELHINHLDRKVTLTQKRVEEEAEKMQEDSKKLTKMTDTLDDVDDRLASLEVALPSFAAFGRDWALNNRNLWTQLNSDRGGGGGGGGEGEGVNAAPDEQEKPRTPQIPSKDILAVAEEILRLETSGMDPSSESPNTPSAEQGPCQTEAGAAAGSVLDLDLPDELEDFPLPGLPTKSKPAPVKSTFTLSVGRKNSTSGSGSESDRTNNSGRNDDTDLDDPDWAHQQNKVAPGRDKVKSEGNLPQQTTKTNASSAGSSSTSSAAMPVSPLHQRYLNTNVPSSANLNNLSFDSGQGGSLAGGENSASLASSVSSSTSSLGGGAGEAEEGALLSPSRVKGRYARDFDVTPTQQHHQQQQQKKKWSVTLDPFSPQAEVVNKPPEVEIQEAEVSSSSGQSSPALGSSTPTFARPPPRERPAPVHMVGTTSEAEVPESRTEFNTDGSVELPSVNRLKALFSSNKDDMLANGNFKRVAKHDQIHSITARSVSRQQLDKLKANNQNNHSPSSPSSSSPSGYRQRSPLSKQHQPPASPSDTQLSSSSASLRLSPSLSASSPALNSSSQADSPSFASKVTLRHVPQQEPPQEREKPERRRSQIEDGSYLDVDGDKDPVLIYPEKDPEYWRRQHKLLLQERQQQQQQQQQQPSETQDVEASPLSSQISAPTEAISEPSALSAPSARVTTPPGLVKPSRAQQPRLIVRRATSDVNLDSLEGATGSPVGSVVSPGGGSGGTRIKAGCISARAAFWEKKMMDGGEGVDEDEFPEMVEESDS